MPITPLATGTILNGLKGAESNQGSVQNSFNSAQSQQSGFSQTDAAAAREWSAKQAEIAFNRQKELMKLEMDYNSQEAKKAREWNENMANTVYTRSVNNMREAGINPILAASMGLSGASVGSAQTASISGAQAPMGQSFMDTTSASQGGSQTYGESHGSSWGHSENGIATGLSLLGDAIAGAIGKINSSQKIDIALTGLKDIFNTKDVNNAYSKTAEIVSKITGANENKVKNIMMTKDSGKYKAMKNSLQKNNPALYKSPHRINESGW